MHMIRVGLVALLSLSLLFQGQSVWRWQAVSAAFSATCSATCCSTATTGCCMVSHGRVVAGTPAPPAAQAATGCCSNHGKTASLAQAVDLDLSACAQRLGSGQKHLRPVDGAPDEVFTQAATHECCCGSRVALTLIAPNRVQPRHYEVAVMAALFPVAPLCARGPPRRAPDVMFRCLGQQLWLADWRSVIALC